MKNKQTVADVNNSNEKPRTSRRIYLIEGATGMNSEHWDRKAKASSLKKSILAMGHIAIQNGDKIKLFYKKGQEINVLCITGELSDAKRYLSGNLSFKEIE